MSEPITDMLAGGHPNSLGRTVEVVDAVLADQGRLEELFAAYGSDDPVVRLRVSSALKRIEEARPDWLVPHIDRLIGEVGALDQPSAQWTLAQLLARLPLAPAQRTAAVALLQRNLTRAADWIVLIQTAQTLAAWAASDPALARWLAPELDRLARDPRKSVAGRAAKLRAGLPRPAAPG